MRSAIEYLISNPSAQRVQVRAWTFYTTLPVSSVWGPSDTWIDVNWKWNFIWGFRKWLAICWVCPRSIGTSHCSQIPGMWVDWTEAGIPSTIEAIHPSIYLLSPSNCCPKNVDDVWLFPMFYEKILVCNMAKCLTTHSFETVVMGRGAKGLWFFLGKASKSWGSPGPRLTTTIKP